MTNIIISIAFLTAVQKVEDPPKDNPYRMTEAAWTDAMQWRKAHGQPTWPWAFRVFEVECREAARSFCERNWHWLTVERGIRMPEHDVRFCQMTLYVIYWKGRGWYKRCHSIPPEVEQRGNNVANIAEDLEREAAQHQPIASYQIRHNNGPTGNSERLWGATPTCPAMARVP